MVASDFDDTLLPSSKIISGFTRETIKKYIATGGRFVLSTGRMFASIKQEAQDLGLSGEVIAYQGALIKDLDTDKVLRSVEIAPELAIEYIEFLNRYSSIIQLYMDDRLFIEKNNSYTEKYSALCKIHATAVGNLSKFILESGLPINKVYCYINPADCAEFREKVNTQYGDRLLINSSKPWNVEAVNIKTSKGIALKYLCDMYGIDRSELIAFGDNLNDLEMLTFAGLGVAVGNAVPELKAKADYITLPCDEDGVARAIEKFCF